MGTLEELHALQLFPLEFNCQHMYAHAYIFNSVPVWNERDWFVFNRINRWPQITGDDSLDQLVPSWKISWYSNWDA